MHGQPNIKTTAFPFRQWFCERATMLRYAYIAYLDFTLPTTSRLVHFMDPPPTIKAVARLTYRVIIRWEILEEDVPFYY
jgi:hypothetical protein